MQPCYTAPFLPLKLTQEPPSIYQGWAESFSGVEAQILKSMEYRGSVLQLKCNEVQTVHGDLTQDSMHSSMLFIHGNLHGNKISKSLTAGLEKKCIDLCVMHNEKSKDHQSD